MAIKNKSPVKKGAPVKKTGAATKPKSTGQKLKQAGGAIIRDVADAYSGGAFTDVMNILKPGSSVKNAAPKSKTGKKKHRRGVVPKTVKKWATRYARKRKQTDKVIKNIFGADGSKLIGQRKRRSFGGSPGVITSAEAREAMRR